MKKFFRHLLASKSTLPLRQAAYSSAQILSSDHGHVRDLIGFIFILFFEMHADGFRRFKRTHIRIFAVGIKRRVLRVPERPVAHGRRGFFRVSFSLLVSSDVISDLRQHLPVDILKGKPAVADHLACILQTDCPEPESVILITVHVPLDPGSHTLLIERIGVVLHDLRIGKHRIKGIKVTHRHFPEKKPFCFKYHLHFCLPIHFLFRLGEQPQFVDDSFRPHNYRKFTVRYQSSDGCFPAFLVLGHRLIKGQFQRRKMEIIDLVFR